MAWEAGPAKKRFEAPTQRVWWIPTLAQQADKCRNAAPEMREYRAGRTLKTGDLKRRTL